MRDSYMSMREMAEVCNIKDLKYFRESYITPALESGMIERLIRITLSIRNNNTS